MSKEGFYEGGQAHVRNKTTQQIRGEAEAGCGQHSTVEEDFAGVELTLYNPAPLHLQR